MLCKGFSPYTMSSWIFTNIYFAYYWPNNFLKNFTGRVYTTRQSFKAESKLWLWQKLTNLNFLYQLWFAINLNWHPVLKILRSWHLRKEFFRGREVEMLSLNCLIKYEVQAKFVGFHSVFLKWLVQCPSKPGHQQVLLHRCVLNAQVPLLLLVYYSLDGVNNWSKIFFNFDVANLTEGPYFTKTIWKFKRKWVFFRFDATNTFNKFSMDSNPRTGTDVVSTIWKDTLNSSFLCWRMMYIILKTPRLFM